MGEVVDFMPPSDRRATDNHRLVRMVRCVRGEMSFEVEVAPRYDYGRSPHRTEITEHGAVFTTDALTLTVHAVREPDDERLALGRVEEGDVKLSIDLKAGDVRGLVLESAADGPPREIRAAEFQRMFDDTVAFWRSWLDRCTYTGRWREMLHRSAITLKLMTYAPSGGLVAAPTTGLPEQVGGERNWDYRHTWVRDASFSVYVLLRIGFTEEAAQFSGWLRGRVTERAGGEGGPLNIMYRVDGSSDLKEEALEHWSGYRGSRPVRIGNGASDQLQLDIYGEALDSIFFADRRGLPVGHRGWIAIYELLDRLAGHWDQPEEGIWETRGGCQDFTYGRLMCWVAFDRGIRMAAAHGRPADVDRWTQARDGIYDQIRDEGWSAKRRAFVQHYGSEVLDSSLLRMSSVGFISPYDPLWASTLAAMDDELVTDSLVYRYDPGASPDGLQGSEGTFSFCSFSYVDALARAGRLGDARLAFEKMLTYANHVGLYSEEIALSGDRSATSRWPSPTSHSSMPRSPSMRPSTGPPGNDGKRRVRARPGPAPGRCRTRSFTRSTRPPDVGLPASGPC
jgi:GH15 family glucan-1,4-alpha-glucosidase